MFDFNEICSTTLDPCPLEKTLHFHCNVEDVFQKVCNFITKYGHLMDLHIQNTHSNSAVKPCKISKNSSLGNEDSKLGKELYFVFNNIYCGSSNFPVVKAAGTYFPTEGNDARSSPIVENQLIDRPNLVDQPVPPTFPSIFSALHFAQFTRNLALNLSLPHMSSLFGLPNHLQHVENLAQADSSARITTKNDTLPPGYRKYRYNENCHSLTCTYRNNQSHFHCIREDCNYSFCDKTRFVQHSARHERLDTLMGLDFKQFRSTMRCNVENCVFFQNVGEFFFYLLFLI